MNRIENKVAVITGAALGIGAACARRMREEGATIAILDLHDAEGEALARELGAKARFWRCDVAKEADVKRVFAEIEAHFGRIDILVNNAGVSGANKPTHELSEDEWDFVQSINVKGVFFGTKYAVPAMKRAGGGSIINLSSIYGLIGAADSPPYHASKGAVRLMAKNDAVLYAPDKIRVNSVHPVSSRRQWCSILSMKAARRRKRRRHSPHCIRSAISGNRTISPGAASTSLLMNRNL